MRHGEKLDNELSEEGCIRAEYLPEYFLKHRPKGVPLPTHMISMKPNKPFGFQINRILYIILCFFVYFFVHPQLIQRLFVVHLYI